MQRDLTWTVASQWFSYVDIWDKDKNTVPHKVERSSGDVIHDGIGQRSWRDLRRAIF